jgi:hypothetical protein
MIGRALANKMFGWIIDRSEHGRPGEFAKLSDEQLDAEVMQYLLELAISERQARALLEASARRQTRPNDRRRDGVSCPPPYCRDTCRLTMPLLFAARVSCGKRPDSERQACLIGKGRVPLGRGGHQTRSNDRGHAPTPARPGPRHRSADRLPG